MVSIFGPDGEQAYGVIANVSEGGAQVAAGIQFESGARILLRIGFDPNEPFATPADIVWARDDSDARHKSSYVYGVQFRLSDPEQLQRLRDLLSSPTFEHPVFPGQAPTTEGLDNMMTDLGDELSKLSEKIRDKS
jgi:hypothetical protein